MEADRPAWTILGAPLDSSGAARGERRAPAALRAAGLVPAITAADAGDVPSLLDDPSRDPATGITGFGGLVTAVGLIRRRLAALLDSHARPLVVGGDCSILLGIAAALHDRHQRAGLWFVDGHADFYSGQTSPSGEAADMDLALVTGHRPAGLLQPAEKPLIAPTDVLLLGHRRAGQDPDAAEELALLPRELSHLDATAILQRGPQEVGRTAERRLSERLQHVWLHIDLDVLDAQALPAVTYQQPHGLGWEALTALLRPLAASPALVGVSMADFNPDLDPAGSYARRVVGLLSAVLGGARKTV